MKKSSLALVTSFLSTGLATGLIAGLASASLFIGCGGSQTPPPESAGTAGDEVKDGTTPEKGLSGSASSKLTGGDQLVPKAAKRSISDDDRADFEKVLARYTAARKAGKVDSDCESLSSAFAKVADSSPGLVEARFNQGAVLQECGKEDEAVRIWENMPKYGPAITNLGYVSWRKGDTNRAESLFNHAVDIDPLHTIEARNNLAQLLRDKARRASSDGDKKTYVNQAVTHLRTVLALDSDNLQAFATLAFVYYDLNMLEMAKLVGNQAIKKGEEIATGKFDEEKTEDKSGEKGKKGKKGKKAESSGDDGKLAKEENVQGEGTGYTQTMKDNLALVYNTMGLVELKRKKISPAISQFRKAVEMNPKLAEARMNLAALSLNNRDYKTAEENFRSVLGMQPKNYEAVIGLGVALRGNKKIDDAEAQYNNAQKLDSSNPSSYFNLGLLYQDYKGGDKPVLQKAQEYYRQFLSKVNGNTPDALKKEAEKRIKDIDETFVALAEAAKMQAEAEEMQKKAEEQQKKMEEEMKKQEAAEAAAKGAAAAPAGKDGAAAAPAGKDGAPAAPGAKDAAPGTQPPPANGAAAAPAAGAAPSAGAAPAADAAAGAAPADDAKGKKKKKKSKKSE
ncbi:MAG TPA: tetratricopeptide repeat protein [Polyangia bacterium]